MKNLAHYLLFYSLMNSALTFGQSTPAITSFSPLGGPAGTTVTILGANFSTIPEENTVYFGAAKASISSASASQLVVIAPFGATSQPITVTVNGLTAYSNVPFSLTFPFSGSIGSSFPYRTDFWSGYTTRWETICDLDGDGKNDVVVADEGANVISVLRNTSTPGYISWDSFQPKLDFSSGSGVGTYAVATGDLDGDGKPDVVAGNIGGTTISVFYNISAPGFISFSPAVEFEALSSPSFVAIHDLDLDGKSEIVVSSSNNYGDGYVSIFRNVSAMGSIPPDSFAPRVDLLAGHGGVWGVALNDVDGDGKTDIAVTSGGDGLVSVFRNISAPGSITSDSFEPKVDFATAGYPSIVLLADMDGDSKNDLIVGNAGDGAGGYTTSIFRNISSPGSITTSSFDVRVNLPSSDGPWNPAVGDLNGDGRLEIIVRGSPGMLSIFKNMSSPGTITSDSFSSPYTVETGGASLGISIVDMDGDGKSDLTISNEQWNVISVYRNLDLPDPVPPSALPATFVSNTGFEAEWNSISNVYEYHLDVSTTDAFESFVSGYEDKIIYNYYGGLIRNTVSGLMPNTNYFYRVRATGINGNSSSISVKTLAHPLMTSPNVWVKQNSGNGNEEIHSMTSDDKGNIYAAGFFTGTITLGSKTFTSQGQRDLFFVRYDYKGRVDWARSIGGIGNDTEVSIATDSKGLYITAQFSDVIDVDPGNGVVQFTNEGQYYLNDGFFAKYNLDNGKLEWARKLVDAAAGCCSTIEVDHSGVYLTGHYNGTVDFDPGYGTALRTSQGDDVFLTKYSLKGKYLWASSMGGYDWDSGFGLLVDASGVYVSGYHGWGSDFDPSSDYYPLDGAGGFYGRYDLTNGNLIYAKTLGNGIVWGLDKHGKDLYISGEFNGTIDADPDGSGQFIGTDGLNGGMIGKYNKLDGSFRWAKSMVSTAWIGPRRVLADGSGVYVNGYFGGSVNFDSGSLVANRTAVAGSAFASYYESNGKLDWVKGIWKSRLCYINRFNVDG